MQGMKNDLKKHKNLKKIKNAAIRTVLFAALNVGLFLWYLSEHETDRHDLTMYGALIIFAVIAIGSLIELISAILTTPYRDIKRFCKRASVPADALVRLEKTWANGFDFGEGRIDREYIILIKNHTARVIALGNAVWVYIDTTEQMKGFLQIKNDYTKTTQMEFNFLEHFADMFICQPSPEAINAMLDYIRKNKPEVVTEYSENAEKLYNDGNMDGLKELARKHKENS
ncbi:MAG: hypothetical protein FWD48_11680 [Oscillospiraceae bacterium]|nr:hypothetical protein [Oscillospiraceae bacterium]